MPGESDTTVPQAGRVPTTVVAAVDGPGHAGSVAVPAAATVQAGFTVPAVGHVSPRTLPVLVSVAPAGTVIRLLASTSPWEGSTDAAATDTPSVGSVDSARTDPSGWLAEPPPTGLPEP